MAKLRVEDLENREFDIAQSNPAVLRGEQLSSALTSMSGKRIFVEFDNSIEGPQRASELVQETMTSYGTTFVSELHQAEIAVWIGGTGIGQFAFVVMDTKNDSKYKCYLCGPSDLTAAIMTTIVSSCTDDKPETAGSDVESLLSAVAKTNALLLGGEDPERHMVNLEQYLSALGKTHDERAIKAILDAVADAVGTIEVLNQQIDEIYEHPNATYRQNMLVLISDRQAIAKSLCNTAILALAEIGKPALGPIENALPKVSHASQKAFRRALRKIKGPWWQFW